MSIESTLRELASTAQPKLVEVLLRAYELGYRDALAARPEAASPATTTTSDAAADVLPDDPSHASQPEDVEAAPSERSGLFDPADDAAEASAVAHEPATAPRIAAPDGSLLTPPLIRASARVGTLVERIHHYFGLARFDVEIVVCRKGDTARRQLRSDVRLSRYSVAE